MSGFPISEPGLSFKLLVVVIGISLVGVLVSSFLVLTHQWQQMTDSARTAATHLSDTIEASLEHAMVDNDWVLVSRIVQTEGRGKDVETIRVLDAQGGVQISSKPEEVGERFDRDEPSCQFCHPDAVRPGNQTAILTSEDGRETMLNVNLIRNRPQCAGCHDPQSKVLGLLMIERPLSDLRSQLAASFLRIALSALATFALLVGLTTIVLRKLVIRPVGDLARAVAEISAGNLGYQVQATGHGELGELAEAFDAMRQRLNVSVTEMERRNQELLVLNDVALTAGQLLDLQQILELALNTVVNRLGMQAGAIYLLDRDADRLTLRASQGLSEAQCREIERLRQQPGGDLSRQVAQTGDGIFVTDVATDSRFRRLWEDPQGRSYVNIPLKSRGTVVGTLGLVTYAGQPLAEREVGVLKAVGHEIGIAIDNVTLLAETRQREQEATTLYQLGTQMSASLELGQVLDAVAEGARQVLFADIGVVGLLDGERGDVVVKATAGTRTKALKGMKIPVRADTAGSVLAAGRPLVVEEYKPDMPAPRDVVELIAAEGIVSLLVVPLWRGDRLRGLVGVLTRQRRHFSQGEVRHLTRLAHQVVVAVENAQLYQQVRHLTALEERDRLARELHDRLAQALGYLNLKATITRNLLSSGQIDQAWVGLLELKEVAKETYTDVREAIFNLRATESSSGLRLLPTLREYLAEYRAHYGVDARLVEDYEDGIQISPDVDIQLIRIIQEALTNVRKHAGASKTWIRLEQDGNRVRITVEDDGHGFDPTRVVREGRQFFGLQIMRERAASVGGNLELDSRPGHGTRVVILVPLAPEG